MKRFLCPGFLVILICGCQTVKNDPAEEPLRSAVKPELITKKADFPTQPRPGLRIDVESDALTRQTKSEKSFARAISSSPGTPLGDYDARLVNAVRECWYGSMVPRTSMKAGIVVVEFNLHFDGRVSEVRMVRNTTDDPMQSRFCENAIVKAAPFQRWPLDLRNEFKRGTREVSFTFHYD